MTALELTPTDLCGTSVIVRGFDHRLPVAFYGPAIHQFDTAAIDEAIRQQINDALPSGIHLDPWRRLWADITQVSTACRLDLDALVAEVDWDWLLRLHSRASRG